MISSIDGLESSLTEDDIKEYLEQVIEEINDNNDFILLESFLMNQKP